MCYIFNECNSNDGRERKRKKERKPSKLLDICCYPSESSRLGDVGDDAGFDESDCV